MAQALHKNGHNKNGQQKWYGPRVRTSEQRDRINERRRNRNPDQRRAAVESFQRWRENNLVVYLPKHAAEQRDYRAKNAAAVRERVKARGHARRIFLHGFKNVPCADCGVRFPPECMDFDHVRGEKSFTICAERHRPMERLIEEISKCDVVCSNCHRIRTRKKHDEVGGRYSRCGGR